MSDQDLVIGAQPPTQGAAGIQVPTDKITVSVFGVFKDSEKKDPTSSEDEYVEQRFPVGVPRHTPEEDIAQFVWVTEFLQQACLRSVGSGGEINFYPLDRFKRFTMKVGVITGVTL